MSGPEFIKPPLNEIRLDREFTLFEPKTTLVEANTVKNVLEYFSHKRLYTGYSPPLNVEVRANYIEPSGVEVTPFNPELSYPWDFDDSNENLKVQKFQHLAKERFELRNQIREKAPLQLNIIFDQSENSFFDESDKKSIEFMKKIRIQLFFSESSFEGRFGELSIDDDPEPIFVETFYPVNMPDVLRGEYLDSSIFDPYGTVDVDPEMHGHPLHLPSDYEKLSQIKGKFLSKD